MTSNRSALEFEEIFLCPEAFKTSSSKGRVIPVEESDIRTVFQRDRDRIIHCKSFRRLMHKMQVFLSPEGDHYRTRLTHTLEVTQIARTIARALHLNEDLVEAAALGHDLGHTPFGHSGERALNELLVDGFRHNEQSLRIVEKLEHGGKGLNLTFEVKEGIVCHTGDKKASTLEGNIIKLADRIAYVNHDIDDAIRAGILTNEEIPTTVSDVIGCKHGERIENLVSAVLSHGVKNGIGIDEPYASALDELRNFLFDRVYRNSVAKSEDKKVMNMISFLFEYFLKNPDSVPKEYLAYSEEDGLDVVVADYIAGMTDRYAIECFKELFVPKVWQYK